MSDGLLVVSLFCKENGESFFSEKERKKHASQSVQQLCATSVRRANNAFHLHLYQARTSSTYLPALTMGAKEAELRTAIAELLDDADLDSVTAKKIRTQLEAKLNTDLTDQRKEVDKLIMEILNARQAKSDEEESAEEEQEEEEEDEKPKRRNNRPVKKNDTKAKSGGGGKRAAGTGYTKVCKLSPELAAVMGEPAMARHEVVKKMWKIVKEKNLYDPKNKQFAICNDELFKVIGIKRFRTFGMMKYLKSHFVD